jgi:hypothetical protein
MSVSVDTKGLFEKVFDSFKKITPALIAVALATGLILFLPETVLGKMSLSNLQDNWKRVIGIVFIVSLALIVTIVIVGFCEYAQSNMEVKQFRKNKRKHFINLPPEYKQILIDLLRSNNRTIKLNPTSGDTIYLQNNQFILPAQPCMFFGLGSFDPVLYAPEPWLIDLYNKEPELFKLS